jgi:hypothetical protein
MQQISGHAWCVSIHLLLRSGRSTSAATASAEAATELRLELAGGSSLGLALTSIAALTSTVVVTVAATSAAASATASTVIAATEHAAGRSRAGLLDVRLGYDLGGEMEPLAEVVETLRGEGVVVVLPWEAGLDVAARGQRLAWKELENTHGRGRKILTSLDDVKVLGVDVAVLGEVEVLLCDENALCGDRVSACPCSKLRKIHERAIAMARRRGILTSEEVPGVKVSSCSWDRSRGGAMWSSAQEDIRVKIHVSIAPQCARRRVTNSWINLRSALGMSILTVVKSLEDVVGVGVGDGEWSSRWQPSQYQVWWIRACANKRGATHAKVDVPILRPFEVITLLARRYYPIVSTVSTLKGAQVSDCDYGLRLAVSGHCYRQ